MRRLVPLVLVLTACLSTQRHGKNFKYRPLEVGEFAGYKIEVCASGGHVVRLLHEPDERGEAGSRERIEAYKKQYLMPKLEIIEIKGWSYDNACAKGGLTLATPVEQQGEALHRIGATLKANPTDIEVTVVPAN